MAVYWPTPGYKGRTFQLCVLTRCDFNFCIRSSPLRGEEKEEEKEQEKKGQIVHKNQKEEKEKKKSGYRIVR